MKFRTFLLFAVLVLRLFYLQITTSADYARESEENRITQKRIKALRGLIYDRNERVLARNRAFYTVSLERTTRKDFEAATTAFTQAIGDSEINSQYSRRHRTIRLKRDVDFRTKDTGWYEDNAILLTKFLMTPALQHKEVQIEDVEAMARDPRRWLILRTPAGKQGMDNKVQIFLNGRRELKNLDIGLDQVDIEVNTTACKRLSSPGCVPHTDSCCVPAHPDSGVPHRP